MNNLPTKEEYARDNNVDFWEMREWSEPMYQCECGGGMRKNLQMVCASYPPMYVYKCNKCGKVDYLSR